jgi:uncharacterized protein YjbI with pentapeptide repeats
MIEALINAFDRDISNCLSQTNSTVIEVYDCYDCAPSEQRSYIRNNDNQPIHFKLSNSQKANLLFVALDNCVLQSADLSRCDFVIGNFQKLYFVEIKQVSKGQRRSSRINAIDQLHSSITLFREKLDLTHTELIAVICLKAKLIHPLKNATSMAAAVAFKQNYNAILMEGQSDIF